MAQQGRGKGFAVVLSMVAIAGVVGYLIYRRFKNKPKTDTQTDTGFTPAPTSTGGSFTPAPPSSGGGSSSSGNPFATKEDLIKFQQWVINTKGDKTILGKGGSTGYGDDGIWGSKSASAWAKYQKEYPKGGATSSTSWDGRGSVKSTESGVNVWKDLKFTKPYGSTAGSQLQKSVSGKYIYNPIPSGAYMGEATGVIVADSSGVQYREVVAPSDKQDLFKDSNNNVVTKAYVNRNKTTKY